MKYLFEAIDKAIAEHENDNPVIVGCYLTIEGYGKDCHDKQIKYEYNGSTFEECPRLLIVKRGV
jgi:hypothetical protein